MTKVGDLVKIPDLGDNDLYVVIGQAPKGYWVQNQRTGAMPVKEHSGKSEYSYSERKYVTNMITGGYMPKDMISTGGRHFDYAQLACQIAGTVHSDDTVEHYFGSDTPEHVCGYHFHANTEWRNQSAN